ncbi:SDR family NAD(P)-dependent oxidoreductase [Novosphingobium taihuense]|uniref:NAD(P)-dependent dehydrogenase (Short-subunit alcohol dehydrogenase family) n=1 Tax=Novosphingobium taihuense TaxID=260085 RepID=A0A7W7ADS3_9SPHN|nr:SDR family NAD(P)-dependent oxidoreductase [Novosphingobium taihuense]MBB4615036.1 NAD(P)-dependent dehydrogenase (short-subunit alcohol dehydrogenase family) [Novosphingobium taihuense]TWH84522.1 NAD(P)-dependent dehydrogenase (short-subunit alcohol dehydrogenase family) [Novosphingobium taihuense]
MESAAVAQIRFDDRVAIVTGAGNGLGREYALELARRGAKVVVNDLGGSGSGVGASATAAERVVEEIRDLGGTAVANTDSVATRAGGASVVQTALDAWGRVDVLISNAGFLRNSRFEDLTDEQIDPIIDVHLKAAFYVGQPAYRAMRANGYGRMLFTGSASAMFGHAWQANYASGKGAMVGLSNVIALEGSAYGIQSNVLLPTAVSRLADEMDQGFMEIPEFAKSIQTADFSASDGRVVPEFNTPLALYLVSENCQATHGLYSSNSGRYARVRICAGEGWVAPKGSVPPTLEDISTHFDKISELGEFSQPMTVYEEFTAVAAAARKQGVYP